MKDIVQAISRRFPEQAREIRFLLASNDAFRELGRDFADVLAALDHGTRANVDPSDHTQQELQRLRRELEHDMADQLARLSSGTPEIPRAGTP